MQKLFALLVLAALVSAVPQSLNDLTGQYSLWRPPMWPDYETCCYFQGANITLNRDNLNFKGVVIGPCASIVSGTQGLANMQLTGKVTDLPNGNVVANFQFFSASGAHIVDRQYNIKYSTEATPRVIDILTLTQVGNSNCTFELRNDTQVQTTTQLPEITTFFGKFLARLQKLSNKLDMFFTKSAQDFTGKFSLWRPPTWQNFSNCCYLMGSNVTYNDQTKEFTHQAVVMGPCAGMKNLPGTNGVMVTKLTSGSFSDSSMTFSASFTVQGEHITDKTFTVTTSTELTPAPVDIYVYHNTEDGTDSSCDFKLRKDTQ